MFKQDAINYFGSKSKLAKAAGVAPRQFPFGVNSFLKKCDEAATGFWGVLQYDPEVYDQHAKAKRSGEVNHENQA